METKEPSDSVAPGFGDGARLAGFLSHLLAIPGPRSIEAEPPGHEQSLIHCNRD